MLIGLISDTHENILNVQKAVEIFKKRNIDLVIHLGDIISGQTLTYFKGLPLKFIRGNCHSNVERYKCVAKELNFEFLGRSAELNINNKTILVMHQDPDRYDPEKIGKYDYLFHGHTHRKRDETIKGTRLINPGAHYFTTEKQNQTIAILNTENNYLEFIQIE